MTERLRDLPAWSLTACYVVASLGGGLLVSVWVAVVLLVLFIAVLGIRGVDALVVIATIFGVSGALLLAADLLALTQPWKEALSLLLPGAVYIVCDRPDRLSGEHG